jgi:hypothetical protein
LAPQRPNQEPSGSWCRSSQATPRRAAGWSAIRSAASISTMCAVTSAVGGSITAPKSQNGSFSTSRRVLSASNAPQPPSADCIPITQAMPRSIAARRPAASPPVTRRSASTTSAVSSVSG